MINEYDLFQELQAKLAELEISVKQLRHSGSDYAAAERDYKIALRQKALELRASDTAVTLIQLIVYGEKDVAEKRFIRDTKEAIYKANLEHINATKLYIRIIENQLNREWNTDLAD